MSEDLKAPFVATLKAGTTFDSPWLVVSGNTATELKSRLDEITMAQLEGHIATAGSQLQAAYNAAKGLGATPVAQAPVQRAAPAAVQQAPAPSGGPQDGQQHPTGRACEHGVYVYKAGVSKAGNSYRMWKCPANFRTECKPDFIR